MENYGPVSILNCFSKIYEKHILEQFKPFLNDFLSQYMVAYKVHYSPSRALMRLIEHLKKAFDENFVASTVLMDLSKVFDCIPHDLLMAKLRTYGFSEKNGDLHNRSIWRRRKQNVKIHNIFSSFQTLLSGALQGSILGQILLNIISEWFTCSTKKITAV